MSKTIIEQPKSVYRVIDRLIDRTYIGNVQNRLRQLSEPTDNDCKRWVWELIQNAKDSISQDKNRNSVDIKLVIREKEAKFLHNGSPFTADALYGLLYKYSEGKENDSESTGRFGTGFLTTHTLSKVVSIEGDVFREDSNNSVGGFSTTMYREGLDKTELLEGLAKTRKIIYTQETNNWTTYTYHLRTPQNEKALRLGLDNFISNIAQTMLFCKELNSVELDNNGILTKIIREESTLLDSEDNIYLSQFKIEGENTYTRRFIHKSLKKHDEHLTKRFKTERDVRLIAAIEVDSNNNLIENQDSPSHFCVLPLVGSEKHVMPIYLNSPDFEPDSERESLILIGEDILADKGVISEGGINRLILRESIELYESLVAYLSNNGYHKLFLLAKGLRKLPKFEKNFNKKWFEEGVIEPYRDILKKHNIVETEIGNQKLFTEDNEPNIIIPKDSNIDNQRKIYDFSRELFSEKLPLPEITNDWAKVAWDECGLFKIEDLCEHVSEKKCIDNLPISSNKYEWLNNFLTFIKEQNESLLKEYALIPNRNKDFVLLNEEKFAEGVEIADYMITVLNDLGLDLTPTLLNENITAINLPLKIDRKSIAEKINEQTKAIIKENNSSIESTITRLLPLLNTIPTDETIHESEFINKQRQIHDFTKTLYPNLPISENTNNDIPQKAFQELHKWLTVQLMQTVSKLRNVGSLPESIGDKIKWINSFIAFVAKDIKEGQLDECAIIPNQKGYFCFKKDLSKDAGILEELKTERAERFGIKLKDILLHKEIDAIDIKNIKDINYVIQVVNKMFEKNCFEKEDSSLQFAIFLVHFIPKDEDSMLHRSQKALLDITRKYYYQESSSCTSTAISCTTEEFWRKANDEIAKHLQIHLEQKTNLQVLEEYLTKSGKEYDHGDTIILLNDIYNYLEETRRTISKKIIPNQNGVFCLRDGIYKDNNIPNELKNILHLITPEKDFRDILADDSLSIQLSHSKNTSDIAQILDKEINNIYKDGPRAWDNEKFKEAIELLMMGWFPKHKDTARENFPQIYKKKEAIEINVLWSLEDRQRMQRARNVDPELLDQFIEASGDITLLEEQKEKLKEEVAELTAQATNASVIAEEFPDMTADRIRGLLKLEERIKGWDTTPRHTPDEEQERRNYENGYKGEAYVYKQLLRSGKFNNVIWPHKSPTPADFEITDYEGDTHYIKDDYAKYDLAVETLNGNKIYIEVKSTSTSLSNADAIALPISIREWKFIDEISENESYYLARVFNVANQPEVYYLSSVGGELP